MRKLKMIFGMASVMLLVSLRFSVFAEDVSEMQAVNHEEIVEEGQCGEGLTYQLDASGTLTVLGSGELADQKFSENESIKNVVLSEGVTKIGSSTFWGCTSLQSVEIPSSVKIIGVGAFKGCVSLQEIQIPEGVEEIWAYAFSGCESVREVTLPNSVNNVGVYTFNLCKNLERATLSNAIESVESGMFMECHKLTEIHLPLNIRSIEGYAFANCTSLKSIILPPLVSSLSYYTFGGCSALEEVTILNGDCSFYYSFDEPVSEILVIYGVEGSEVQKYALEHGIGFRIYDGEIDYGDKRPIGECRIEIEPVEYVYTGEERRPDVKVYDGTKELMVETDYTCAYRNNVDAGSAEIVLTGKGTYFGRARKNFMIQKAEQELELYLREGGEVEVDDENVLEVEGIGELTFSSSNEKIVEVDSSGGIYGKRVGTAWITVTASGDENYRPATAMVEIKVVKHKKPDRDPNQKPDKDPNKDPDEHTHQYSAYVIIKKPSALTEGVQARTCMVCGKKEEMPAAKLMPTMQMNAADLKLKKGQKTTAFQVTDMAEGDYVKYVQSDHTEVFKVSRFEADGTMTLKAGKKPGKAKLTITLASGLTRSIYVKVQNGIVKTKKISGIARKSKLKKGKKFTLNPMVTPITSQEKVTYHTSNKKIAAVNAKD